MSSNQEVILITNPETILHFTGVYCEGYLLIGAINYLLTDARYFYAVKNSIDEKFQVSLGAIKELKDLLVNQKLIGIDYFKESVWLYNEISRFSTVFDASAKINRLIAKKNDYQLDLIQTSCAICEKAFLQTIENIKIGMTELDVATILEYNFKMLGASGTSFDTIVAFAENSAVPHHQTSNKVLEDNSVILMDFGCKYKGYCSDMTRTLFFGNPTDEFLDVYSSVQSAHLRAKKNIKSGMKASQCDLIARNSLKNAGFDEYFTHSLGHGIGTLIHEYPSLSKRANDDDILLDGYVFSIEPGVYLDGKFGVRIEDTVYLSDGKVKSFMTDDLNLKIIGK